MPTSTRVLVLSFAVALATVASRDARAEATGALEEGRRLVLAFEYDAALARLETIVADQDTTAAVLVRAYELLAVTHLETSHDDLARGAIESLLDLDPAHEMNDPAYPPRVLEFFRDARGGHVPRLDVDLVVATPEVGEGDAAVAVQAQAAGEARGVADAVLFVRDTADGPVRRVDMTRDGRRFTASVPIAGEPADMSYYVELRAPSGYVLARHGSASEPRRVALRPEPSSPRDDAATAEASPPADAAVIPPGGGEGGAVSARRPFYRSWWFWTVVGVVVAGGVTAGAVLGTQDEEGPAGSIGHLDLP